MGEQTEGDRPFVHDLEAVGDVVPRDERVPHRLGPICDPIRDDGGHGNVGLAAILLDLLRNHVSQLPEAVVARHRVGLQPSCGVVVCVCVLSG